jgi:hypothetical protein
MHRLFADSATTWREDSKTVTAVTVSGMRMGGKHPGADLTSAQRSAARDHHSCDGLALSARRLR